MNQMKLIKNFPVMIVVDEIFQIVHMYEMLYYNRFLFEIILAKKIL